MLRKQLFCITCIFLCAQFLSRAQDRESMAVEYERIVFEGAGLAETNDALRAKAECYKQLGRWSDASATLARVRLFALTPEERTDVLYQQELCFFMTGDFGQAASLVGEVGDGSADALLLHALALAYAGRYDESEIYAARYLCWDGASPRLQELLDLYSGHPRELNSVTVMALSFLPPLGHFYCSEFGEGALSGTLNAASLAFTVANLASGYWITGLLGGGIALDQTLMGAQQRCAQLIEKHRTNDSIAFGDKLRSFLLQD